MSVLEKLCLLQLFLMIESWIWRVLWGGLEFWSTTLRLSGFLILTHILVEHVLLRSVCSWRNSTSGNIWNFTHQGITMSWYQEPMARTRGLENEADNTKDCASGRGVIGSACGIWWIYRLLQFLGSILKDASFQKGKKGGAGVEMLKCECVHVSRHSRRKNRII